MEYTALAQYQLVEVFVTPEIQNDTNNYIWKVTSATATIKEYKDSGKSALDFFSEKVGYTELVSHSGHYLLLESARGIYVAMGFHILPNAPAVSAQPAIAQYQLVEVVVTPEIQNDTNNYFWKVTSATATIKEYKDSGKSALNLIMHGTNMLTEQSKVSKKNMAFNYQR